MTIKMPERLGGQWQHALFLTYTVDLEFFEHQVWWPLPETCRNVVVLADEDCFLDACEREASRRLVNHLNRRYVVDGLRFQGAAHAKLVLLTNEKEGRLLIGSGNLGPRGWVRGGEVFTEYGYGGEDPDELPPFLAARDLLTELLEEGRIVGIARERIELLLTETPWLYEGGVAEGAPVRHNLDRTFLEQLVEVVGGRSVQELRVLSPFYDPMASALSELLTALEPAASEIYVEPGCTSVDPERLTGVRDAQGATCQVRPFKREGCDYVHAKAYLAKTRDEDVLLTGSPNLSRGAMLSLAGAANFEVASLLTGPPGEFDHLFEDLLAAPPQADLSALDLELADSGDVEGDGVRFVLVRAVLRESTLELYARGLQGAGGLGLRVGEDVHRLEAGFAGGDLAVVDMPLDDELREKLSRCVPVRLLAPGPDGEIESNPVFVMDRAALAAEARSPQSRAVTSVFIGIPLDDELAEIVMPLEIAFGDFRGAWRPAAKAANPALSVEDEDRFIAYESVDLEAVRQHPKIQQYLHSHGVHNFGDGSHETVLDMVPLSVAEFFRQFAHAEARPQRWEEAAALRRHATALVAGPLVIHQEAANRQHYELPTAFFREFLGPRLKYSCCLWSEEVRDLAAGEEAMLALSCERAGLEDGMDVLDLGCGWGSLALFIAERYPRCRVTAMSNSRTQIEHIAGACRAAGSDAIAPVTADIATFDPGRRFDRILSVEMLEHVRDYRELFARLRRWLAPDGRVFVHVFSHARFAYTFSAEDPNDWMGSRFFSGGQMPAHDLFLEFQDDLMVEEHWWLSGEHYGQTLEAWLRRYDDNAERILPLFERTYGVGAASDWQADWRLFLLACAETFAYGGGREWGVSHYLLAAAEP